MNESLVNRIFVVALFSIVLTLAAHAKPQRQLIGMSHDHLAADAIDCDHFLTKTQTSFAGSAHEQEQREFAVAGLPLLRVNAGREGGISVRGWDKPNASIIICKYAAAESKAAAVAMLAEVTVVTADGSVTAAGPESTNSGTWWVNMILYVPRNAKLEVVSENGAIAIRNMIGAVTARATNGGISVADCGGSHKVTTVSGGISLEKISGRLDATTKNGPIAYKLRDQKTPSLEARTEDAGEIVCNLTGCADGAGNWTANRKRLRLGGSTPSIRLSTGSAAIVIDQVR